MNKVRNNEYDFRKIKFGCADAQTEGLDYPELMTSGYVDIEEVVGKALNTGVFLFLGYKGSGKSSLSEHLRLSGGTEYFVDQQGLKSFPFKSFGKIIAIEESPIYKAKQIWRWVLCVKILNDLLKDQDAISENYKDVERAISLFTRSGIYPLVNISDVVSHTSTKSFKAKLKNAEIASEITNEEGNISIEMATEFLMNVIVSYKECRKHILIIDDLDDVLAPNGTQFNIISALIGETKDLNRFFQTNYIPVKIIVLCRSDMFERLPDPNKNKIKQDSSFSFSWYDEGVNKPYESKLINLINTRVQLIYPDINNAIEEFFPKFYKSKSIYNVLLDFTRHTPRDFIQLLNYIQKQCTACYVKTSDIEEGLKAYSSEYFIQEIKDEMTGYVNRQSIEELINVISTLRKRDFSYSELVNQIEDNPLLNKVDCVEILRIMYDCSAIGHVFNFVEDNSTRVTFKYRNRNSTFTTANKIILHQGLWQSLNVNY